MINLISYNITYGDRFNNDRTDSLKVHYECNFDEPTQVKVYLGDSIFNTESQVQELTLQKGIWWTEFFSRNGHSVNHNKQITNAFIEPLNLVFINKKTDKVIKEFKLDFKFVDVSLRSRNQKINAWIFGDSHIGTLAKDIDYNELEYSNIRINPISKVGLTMNRFSNSKYLGYLDCFPIYDKDLLLFNLGEIDMRVSIHIKSFNKQKPKIIILNEILDKYFNALKSIKQNYPNNPIIILKPNAPIGDDYFYPEKYKQDYFLHSNKKDRKLLNETFDQKVLEFIKQNPSFYYIGNNGPFKDSNGFIKNELLMREDIHMESNKSYFDSLYQHLKAI